MAEFLRVIFLGGPGQKSGIVIDMAVAPVEAAGDEMIAVVVEVHAVRLLPERLGGLQCRLPARTDWLWNSTDFRLFFSRGSRSLGITSS
jgi:hypothetical protein